MSQPGAFDLSGLPPYVAGSDQWFEDQRQRGLPPLPWQERLITVLTEIRDELREANGYNPESPERQAQHQAQMQAWLDRRR